MQRILIVFLTKGVPTDEVSDIPGHKKGYMIKLGRNFGGWKSRYYVLDGPVLTYFDSVRKSMISFAFR
jgi:RalA-binding protein 1